MAIPQDPIILLSYVNTQLRDFTPAWTSSAKAWTFAGRIWRKNWRQRVSGMTPPATSSADHI